jgi:hypothetical protein
MPAVPPPAKTTAVPPPRVKKVKPVKPASPKKAKQVPNMRENLMKKKEKPVPTISVHAFADPVCAEVYSYTVLPKKDGFTYKYRMWCKGDLTVDELTDANFIGLKMRRDTEIPGNETLKDSEGYSRIWLLRYPPGLESTADTRKEGLQVLQKFFMSKISTTYPPKDIKLVDSTLDERPVMESFFLDDDIEEILTASCESDVLNDQFYVNYPDFATKVYSFQEPSDFAKEKLGFPSMRSPE